MYTKSKQFKTWSDFKRSLENYSRLSLERRRQLIFRGQGDARWPLYTTLDRWIQQHRLPNRSAVMRQLLSEFRREAVGLNVGGVSDDDLEWELLARHHGLPTPILDWTESPLIAAFFAFEVAAPGAELVSVWTFDREVFERTRIPAVEVIEDERLIRVNPRAIEQRAVFLRFEELDGAIEDALRDSLYRFDIPSAERQHALDDLDEGLVNARSLFRDLDAAARTAARRTIGESR